MADKVSTKKDRLILDWGENEVHSTHWFCERGIDSSLLRRYSNNGIFYKLGGGAYAKTSDKLDWQAAIYTAQKEFHLPIHVGGRTVFELLGTGHYLNIGARPVIYIMTRKRIRTPVWIVKNDWGVEFMVKNLNIFEGDIGLNEFKKTKFAMKISSRERAIMEMIDILDLRWSFETLEQYFESLTNIKADVTQCLLENCKSVKVKRMFLYMANRLNLPVVKKINEKRIDMGSGKRTIAINGQLDKKFDITVPRHFDRNS